MANTKTALQDRLVAARKNRSALFDIAGTTLDLHRWNMEQSMRHMTTITDALKTLILEGRGNAVKKILEQDMAAYIKTHGAIIKDIIADTVTRGNFETIEEASQWVDELGIEEIVSITQEIFKRNCGPLAEKLGLKNPLASPALQLTDVAGASKQ